MKGKNPTRMQRKVMEANNLKSDEWLIQKDSPKFMQVVNRKSKEEKVIQK